MSQCLKDNAALDPTLLHHDVNLTYGAEDDSYRYTGANPNNYVCFGSEHSMLLLLFYLSMLGLNYLRMFHLVILYLMYFHSMY